MQKIFSRGDFQELKQRRPKVVWLLLMLLVVMWLYFAVVQKFLPFHYF